MTETAVMQSDLDRLTERVERTAQLVNELREQKLTLTRERDQLAQQVQEIEHKLQGQDVSALLAEINGLRKEQREWQGERREVASRVESMLKKLERLEA